MKKTRLALFFVVLVLSACSKKDVANDEVVVDDTLPPPSSEKETYTLPKEKKDLIVLDGNGLPTGDLITTVYTYTGQKIKTEVVTRKSKNNQGGWLTKSVQTLSYTYTDNRITERISLIPALGRKDTARYTYDNSGRVSKVLALSKDSVAELRFEYGSSTMSVKGFERNRNNKVFIESNQRSEYTLKSGRITSMTLYSTGMNVYSVELSYDDQKGATSDILNYVGADSQFGFLSSKNNVTKMKEKTFGAPDKEHNLTYSRNEAGFPTEVFIGDNLFSMYTYY